MLDISLMVWAFAFAEPSDDAKYGDAPRCPACGRYIGAKRWLPPYVISLVEGTKTSAPADVMTGPGIGPDSFIASERFVSEFKSSALTGIEQWEPVKIEGFADYGGDSIHGALVRQRYFVAFFPSPRTRLKLDQMSTTSKGRVECKVCGRGMIVDSYHGVVVDEESWSGEDIVRMTNLEVIVASERFARFFEAGEFTGALVPPANAYEQSFSLKSWER